MAEVRLAELRLSELRLSVLRLSESRLSELRLSEKEISELRSQRSQTLDSSYRFMRLTSRADQLMVQRRSRHDPLRGGRIPF